MKNEEIDISFSLEELDQLDRKTARTCHHVVLVFLTLIGIVDLFGLIANEQKKITEITTHLQLPALMAVWLIWGERLSLKAVKWVNRLIR